MRYFRLDNDFVDEGFLSILSNSALRVFLSLSRRKKNGPGLCFPSLTRLQKDTGMSKQGVLNGLEGLEAIGAAKREEQERGKVNVYRVFPLSEWSTKLTGQAGGLVNEVDLTSQRGRPEVVNDVDPNNTNRKKLNKKTNTIVHENEKEEGIENVNGGIHRKTKRDDRRNIGTARGNVIRRQTDKSEQRTSEAEPSPLGIRSGTRRKDNGTGSGTRRKDRGTGEEDFEQRFWKPYPKRPRGDKRVAFNRYKKIPKKRLPDFWKAVENYFEVCKEKENQYIKMANGFMNPDCWSQYVNEEDFKPINKPQVLEEPPKKKISAELREQIRRTKERLEKEAK